ncbi:MAG: YbbR-like domain-containing protein [Bacteroides sp.]|nr:YbbR-like domain-containing protein [Bacteroides sp.]
MFNTKNIKYYYNQLIGRIRNFILSDSSSKFLIFLFFFIISLGFWLLQTLNDDYETTISFPVRVRRIPNDVVLTSDPPAQMRVTVKDKGTILLNYIMRKNFTPLILDFDDYDQGRDVVKIPRPAFQQSIFSQLNASTSILAISPDTIEFTYSKGNPKQIPVRLKGRVTAGRLNYISDTIFTPDSVIVYAPQQILDTMTAAYTTPLSLQNVTDTTKLYVELEKIKGAKFVPDNVAVTLATDIFTEKSVEVPIIGINFPADKMLRTFPSKVKVTFRIGLKEFKTVRAEDFIITISYEDLLRSGSDNYKVELKAKPREVNDVHISPEYVDFLIEERLTDEH